MESKKVIRKYLGVAGWKRAMAWVFFAAMLVCLFFGIAGTGHDDTAEAESFYPADGVYAYVDAIGLSDWLYKVDSTVYYAAIDVYGNFYIVQLSSSTVDEMAAQRNYWDVESARAPAAYRLYGMTRSMDYETRSDIASVFDMDVAEFDKYFDIYCLDTGTSPSSDEAAMWIVFAMLAGLLWLCVAIVCGQTGKNLKRSLKTLENAGMLDLAAAELEAPTVEILGKNELYLGRSFVFSRGTGLVVRYTDIKWLYKRTQRTNFVTTGTSLIVNTLEKKGLSLLNAKGKDKAGLVEQAAQVICLRNPDVLVGFSDENMRFYKDMVNAAKNR